MHILERFNPNMVVLAREARGLTQQDLAEHLHQHKANVSRLEHGNVNISEDVLFAISEATSFPPQFFLQDGGCVPAHLAYRKRQQVPMRIITPIEAQVNILTRHVQFVTRALDKDIPQLQHLHLPPDLTPAQVAQSIRLAWNIRTPTIENMMRVVEWQGIVVQSFDFGTDRVDSRSMLTEDGYPVIFLNRRLLGDRQRYSLAYELAQLLLHTYAQVSPDRDVSREANEFAAEFLMPRAHIVKDFERGITIPVLGELKRKWKVSMISLLYRADDLGLLTANQKRYLIQQFNQARIRRREPVELDVAIEEAKLMKGMITEYLQKANCGVMEMSAILSLEPSDYINYYG